MIMDEKLILSEDQAVSAVGDTDSTNTLDFGVANPNIGEGTKLVLHVEVSEAAASATSTATLDVDVQHSDDGSSWESLGLKKTGFAVTDLVAGLKIFETPLPYEVKRYLKIVYTVGTEALTSGKFNAYIALV